MKKNLYITNIPSNYGGFLDGGLANHSLQLVLKAKEKYLVDIYSSIDKIKKVNNVGLISSKDNKTKKIIMSLLGRRKVSTKNRKKSVF